MTRKKSAYKPRPIRADALGWVVKGLQPVTTNPASLTLRIKNHQAMVELEVGGTQEDARVIVAALNMTAAFSLNGIGSDWASEIESALTALDAMVTRGRHAGAYKLTPAELNTVWKAISIHEAQLEAVTVQELEQAMDLVAKTIYAGKAKTI